MSEPKSPFSRSLNYYPSPPPPSFLSPSLSVTIFSPSLLSSLTLSSHQKHLLLLLFLHLNPSSLHLFYFFFFFLSLASLFLLFLSHPFGLSIRESCSIPDPVSAWFCFMNTHLVWNGKEGEEEIPFSIPSLSLPSTVFLSSSLFYF